MGLASFNRLRRLQAEQAETEVVEEVAISEEPEIVEDVAIEEEIKVAEEITIEKKPVAKKTPKK